MHQGVHADQSRREMMEIMSLINFAIWELLTGLHLRTVDAGMALGSVCVCACVCVCVCVRVCQRAQRNGKRRIAER